MWFNYPVEKHILRFYRFKFVGYDKPLTIEARNLAEARQKLTYAIERFPELKSLSIIEDSVYLPIFGRTTKTINSVKNVWVGDLTTTGWMPYEEFTKKGYDY